MGSVVGGVMTSKCVHTCEHVTLYGKGDFADVIKVKDLQMVKLFWIMRWVQSNHVSIKNKITFHNWV